MNFHQLHAISETVRQNCNLTEAAHVLRTSQTAVGRQIREIEQELGTEIFVRTGRRFGGLTVAGAQFLPIVERLIDQAQVLREATRHLFEGLSGPLAVAATHAQARYVLPSVVSAFRRTHPEVRLSLHQGSAQQVADMLANAQVDIAIASEVLDGREDLISFACHEWTPVVLVPPGHALLAVPLTLHALARYPLITYDSGYARQLSIRRAFTAVGIEPEVAVIAKDADVIKTYVQLGLGVGIASSLAFDVERDTGLRAIDAGALFGRQWTRLALRRNSFVRAYTYAFLESFAPSLTREVVISTLGQQLETN
ncbi:MAG: CysB family HTH-type transcriptional regulator [Rhodoferax sp.]|nr:CysB family HTH-type transcriptional regulator [Rhodoferax sp.]